MHDKILDVAEKLFMQQGYRGTSTRQIAEVLGITQPNLYYHFKKKEDIYYAVLARLATDVSKNLYQIVNDSNDTLPEKLQNMARFLQKRHPFNFYLMMNDMKHTVSEKISKKLYLIWEKNYQQPFIYLFQTSELPLRNGLSISFIVRQMFLLIASYLDTSERETELSQAIDLFLYGVLEQK
jgi:AcrR family transcriptional regulator